MTFAALCGITYVCFVEAERVTRLVGKESLAAVSKLMGMIIGVIGVQMVANGVMSIVTG